MINFNKIAYCTFFDKNYLLKGLSLHASFIKHVKGSMLWILCMDEYTLQMLIKLKLPRTKLIKLKDFLDPGLKKAQHNRSIIEFYFTCDPSLPLFVLKQDKKLSKVVFLDSDLFFFSSPMSVFAEMGEKSIYVVEHRFPESQTWRNSRSGRFNVGFLIFNNDRQGLATLERWRKQCLNWCYARFEDGKFGDQLYLNEWPIRYSNLHISQNLGINLAPWNISNFNITRKNDKVMVNNNLLINYHFHQFELSLDGNFVSSKDYRINKNGIQLIYTAYFNEIQNQYLKVKNIDPNFIPKRINMDERRKFEYLLRQISYHYAWNLIGIINQ